MEMGDGGRRPLARRQKDEKGDPGCVSGGHPRRGARAGRQSARVSAIGVIFEAILLGRFSSNMDTVLGKATK